MQWEDFAGRPLDTAVNVARDRYMAENVGWLRDQLPAGACMMLWAHNAHVARAAGWMGANLAARYGADYVNAGFAFGTGSFNASLYTANGAVAGPLAPQAVTRVLPGSVEAYAAATGVPRFLVDARAIAGAAPAAPLAGPLPMRLIGSRYVTDADDAASYGRTPLPDDFDLLIYLQTTSASQRLPFPAP